MKDDLMNNLLYVVSNERILSRGIFNSQVKAVLRQIKSLRPDFEVTLLYISPMTYWFKSRRDLSHLKEELKKQNIRFVIFPTTFRSLWVKVWFLPLYLVLTLPFFVYLVRRRKIEIVHCRSYIASLFGFFGKKYLGTKFIFDLRGVYVEEGSLIKPKTWKNGTPNFRIWKWIEKRLLKKADEIVVVSRPFADYVSTVSPWEKINVIPCSSDFLYQKSKRGGKNRLSALGGSTIKIVYTGGVGTWYPLDGILGVFKLIKEVEENSILTILTPANPLKIAQQIGSAGFKPEDYFVTTVSPEEVKSYVEEYQIGLLIRSSRNPIVNKVCFPVKFAEYMACGLPVIVNPETAAIAEIVERHKVGLVFDFKSQAEALDKVRKFLQEYVRMRKNCLHLSHSLTSRSSALKYLFVYEKLEALKNAQTSPIVTAK